MKVKYRAFVEAYLQCWNATEAATRAGYSARSARTQGRLLLQQPEIAEAIRARIAEKAMAADEVLMRLAEQARGDATTLLAEVEEGSPGWKGFDPERLRREGKGRLIRAVTMNRNGFRVEMYDSQAALKLLGKHLGLFGTVPESGTAKEVQEAECPISYEEWQAEFWAMGNARASYGNRRMLARMYPEWDAERVKQEEMARVVRYEEAEKRWALIQKIVGERYSITIEEWRAEFREHLTEDDWAEAEYCERMRLRQEEEFGGRNLNEREALLLNSGLEE